MSVVRKEKKINIIAETAYFLFSSSKRILLKNNPNSYELQTFQDTQTNIFLEQMVVNLLFGII